MAADRHVPEAGRSSTRGRRAMGATTLVALGVVLAACSSSPRATSAGRHRSTGRHPSSASPTTTTTSVPVTTTAPASAGPGASAAGTTCSAAQLAGSVEGEQGGAGTLEVTIALRNTGGTTCTMRGYPGLQLLAASGSPQATSVQPGGPLSFEAVAPATVSLAAGQSASFNVGFTDVPAGGQSSCPTAAAAEVTPPGATDHLRVPLQVQACGGSLHVSAVFGAGSAGSQTTAPPTAG